VNMDQQQLVGISQYSTYFGDEFGTASFFFLVYTCIRNYVHTIRLPRL